MPSFFEALFLSCRASHRFPASDDLDASENRLHIRPLIISPCTGAVPLTFDDSFRFISECHHQS
jgi:hypothetical protein